MNQRFVFPVIHQLTTGLTIEQAELAFAAGADGVFLISHYGRNEELIRPAQELKSNYLDKLIGVNLLGMDAHEALHTAASAGLDMVWTDCPGVTSAGLSPVGEDVAKTLANMAKPPVFFGSVAFKYQPIELNPARAAQVAAECGMLPTTSGAGTGSAPEVYKARVISKALAGGPLAVASGMTPENVGEFLPYFTHYLVATGVSLDENHFDEGRLRAFIETVHAYNAEAPRA